MRMTIPVIAILAGAGACASDLDATDGSASRAAPRTGTSATFDARHELRVTVPEGAKSLRIWFTMPQETRYYVPKLQAVQNIIADPARFGLQLADVPNQPYFVAVTTDRPIDARLAARLAEIPYEEFISLNPAHARPVIRASDSPTLLEPVDKAQRVHANLNSHDQPLVSWQAYEVRKGERADLIAARHGITLARLQEVNGVRQIGPGTTLLVPATGGTVHLPDLPAPPLKTVKVPAPAKTTKTATAQRSPAAGTKKAAARAPAKRTTAAKAPTAGTSASTRTPPSSSTTRAIRAAPGTSVRWPESCETGTT